jgi:hypothetical protein
VGKDEPRRPKKDSEAVIVNRLLGELHRSDAEPQIISDTPLKRPATPRRRLSKRLMPSPRPERPGLATWTRVGLGLVLAIGMTQWPYAHECGFRLLFYAAGVATLLAAGVWSGLFSWYYHLGIAHLVSLGVVVTGLVLGAGVILPRVGYANAAATWRCTAVVTPAPTAVEEATPPSVEQAIPPAQEGTVQAAPTDSTTSPEPRDSIPQ